MADKNVCPTWILFDAVGTLLYAAPPVAEAYCAAGRQFGSQFNVDEVQRRFHAAWAADLLHSAGDSGRIAAGDAAGQSLVRLPTSEAGERQRWRRIVGAVFANLAAARDDLFEQLWQHFARPEHWRLFDDAPQALAALSSRGYRLGIASNFDRRLREIVRGHPPLATCEALFISSEVGFTKPDPRFFAAVTQQLAVAPGQILLVGDDEASDIAGARAAGWPALQVCREAPATRPGMIDTLAQLPDLLLSGGAKF